MNNGQCSSAWEGEKDVQMKAKDRAGVAGGVGGSGVDKAAGE